MFVTGSSGFVGTSLRNSFSKEEIIEYKRTDERIRIGSSSCVVHLAGKAHDLKYSTKSDEYYEVNTEFTKRIFNAFLASDAKIFITLSSVKAVADEVSGVLTEEYEPNPVTHYGKSKLLAERYIFSNEIPEGKRVYILRPSMIHGPGNKGNLSALYRVVSRGWPWPLGAFSNRRSFCSIDNLMFVFKELMERDDIPSGIYNVADDDPLSTNELIALIAESLDSMPQIWSLPKGIIKGIGLIGDKFNLPLNSERLTKLTSSYIVSNAKLKMAIGKAFPLSSRDGLKKTFNSFKN